MRISSHQAIADRGRQTPVRLVREMVLMVLRITLWVGPTALGVSLNMWGAVALLLLVNPGNIWGYFATILGAVVTGCVGGIIIGFGQVLALRRWLDGSASLGSFLSTILASSSALTAGTAIGWWLHTLAGDLVGALSGLLIYGCVFGFIQRPIVDYMSRHSMLWIPVNAAASVLGAMAMLAAFDVSGGRREILQFRYAGVVYSLVVGAAFLWMNHEMRKAVASRQHTAITHSTRDGEPGEPGTEQHPANDINHLGPDPGVLEIHEHRVYRVYQRPGSSDAEHVHHDDDFDRPPEQTGGSNYSDKPDVIDTTYRVMS
jgi:hypothetical protein